MNGGGTLTMFAGLDGSAASGNAFTNRQNGTVLGFFLDKKKNS